VPELPDVVVYVERLTALLAGRRLDGVRIRNPALLRTAEPPLSEAFGRRLRGVERSGKRIVLELDGERFLVLHLMIAGRLKLRPAGAALPGKLGSAAFDFEGATLLLTEGSSHKRAQLHFVVGRPALAAFARGGVEVLEQDLAAFGAALRAESHTLKRALTDPRLFSGIGNAYSDEILHRAQLSPVTLTGRLDDAAVARLYRAARSVLTEWTERLRAQAGSGLPEHVTAFRPEMAVHGRHGQPCPTCGTKVQRIVYASNETNYCPQCQTGGKLLADRALSRLLRKDWPRTLTELEEHMESKRASSRRATRPGEEPAT